MEKLEQLRSEIRKADPDKSDFAYKHNLCIMHGEDHCIMGEGRTAHCDCVHCIDSTIIWATRMQLMNEGVIKDRRKYRGRRKPDQN